MNNFHPNKNNFNLFRSQIWIFRKLNIFHFLNKQIYLLVIFFFLKICISENWIVSVQWTPNSQKKSRLYPLLNWLRWFSSLAALAISIFFSGFALFKKIWISGSWIYSTSWATNYFCLFENLNFSELNNFYSPSSKFAKRNHNYTQFVFAALVFKSFPIFFDFFLDFCSIFLTPNFPIKKVQVFSKIMFNILLGGAVRFVFWHQMKYRQNTIFRNIIKNK